MTDGLPHIAVLIPAYNAEGTIERALNSLAANKEPHDIYVVDDGSRQPLAELLPPRPNLTILRPAQNGGIVKALNLGLTAILEKDYDYVARLDADDASSPDRLEKQRAYMDAHPDVGFVGSWGRCLSEQGEVLFYLNPPEEHDALVRKLHYNNCFLHPSAMMRTSVLRQVGPYREGFPGAEDYDMFCRLAHRAKIANVPAYLTDYTVSTSGISLSRRGEQLWSRLKVQWLFRDWFSPHFYLGLAKTFSLSLLPYRLITALKKINKDYQAR